MFTAKQYTYQTVGIEQGQYKTHCVEFGTDQYFLAMEPLECLEGMMRTVESVLKDNSEHDVPPPISINKEKDSDEQ